ncbi:MAG: hypothetical protein MHM6MM_005000 [Cercozoa sp. M6MM]
MFWLLSLVAALSGATAAAIFDPSCECFIHDVPKSASPGTLKIAFGSCHKQDRRNYGIWSDVAAFQPDTWAWLGDAAYLDEIHGLGRRPVPLDKMKAKWDMMLQREDYSEFLRSMEERGASVVGTWDDHDLGENDGGKSYENRTQAQQLFLDFLSEPADSPLRKQEGVYSAHLFEKGDLKVKLILLDVRYHRDDAPPAFTESDADMLGEEQWQWFERQVKHAAATGATVFIGSGVQVLSDDKQALFPAAESWSRFPKSHERLLNLLAQCGKGTKGVVLLSGDVHLAETNALLCGAFRDTLGFPLVDFTSSGMTHTWGSILKLLLLPRRVQHYLSRHTPRRLRLGSLPILDFNFGAIEVTAQDDAVDVAVHFKGPQQAHYGTHRLHFETGHFWHSSRDPLHGLDTPESPLECTPERLLHEQSPVKLTPMFKVLGFMLRYRLLSALIIVSVVFLLPVAVLRRTCRRRASAKTKRE